MTMTRKNYQAMANMLLAARELTYSEAAMQVLEADDTSDTIGVAVNATMNVVVSTLAIMLSKENPNFDTARFWAATKQKQQ